jgi:glycosyltransferase involved in cell wall biosynthesis
MIVDAVIPALDEEATLPGVLGELLRRRHGAGFILRQVIVVDNGSRDGTARVARARGARVVAEPRRGYGSACLAGLAELGRVDPPPEAVVFLDADGADDPEDLPALLAPLCDGQADLVLGSRVLGGAEPGALSPQQRAGNRVATAFIRVLYGHRYSDLGPFRAIRCSALFALGMRDRGYGWTVEMQVKALRHGLRVVEVPVRYRRRAGGDSKVSGTLRGVVGAGIKILVTIARHARSG